MDVNEYMKKSLELQERTCPAQSVAGVAQRARCGAFISKHIHACRPDDPRRSILLNLLPAVLTYETAFDNLRFGQAAAIMLLIFLYTIALVLIVYFLFDGWGFDED